MKDVIESILPTAMIIISFLSGVIYGIYGDIGKATYWIAGGILNFTVTYMMK